MEDRYSRNIPALTPAEQALLREKRVLVVGCGGLGGYLLELLLRVGLGALRVCDGDVFQPSNLNRQLLCDANSLGRSKVHAAKERAARIAPEATLEAIDTPMTRENVMGLISGCDAVLDALDSIESRRILADACAQAGTPYIFGAIGGWVAQAAVSLPGDGLIDCLYPAGTEAADKSVLSFTPALCAAVQAALCVKLLTGRPVEPGKLYHFDLLNQEFDAIALR